MQVADPSIKYVQRKVLFGSWLFWPLHLIAIFWQVIYSDEERKFNKDITVGLIRSELLNLAEYNVHMAKLLDAGRNSM